eukprot:6212248-Pleurochrysis_carterae.AAC.1
MAQWEITQTHAAGMRSDSSRWMSSASSLVDASSAAASAARLCSNSLRSSEPSCPCRRSPRTAPPQMLRCGASWPLTLGSSATSVLLPHCALRALPSRASRTDGVKLSSSNGHGNHDLQHPQEVRSLQTSPLASRALRGTEPFARGECSSRKPF